MQSEFLSTEEIRSDLMEVTNDMAHLDQHPEDEPVRGYRIYLEKRSVLIRSYLYGIKRGVKLPPVSRQRAHEECKFLFKQSTEEALGKSGFILSNTAQAVSFFVPLYETKNKATG